MIKAVIGSYSDYLDTGIWTIRNGRLEPPADLTPEQSKDFAMVFGELFIPTKGGHAG